MNISTAELLKTTTEKYISNEICDVFTVSHLVNLFQCNATEIHWKIIPKFLDRCLPNLT